MVQLLLEKKAKVNVCNIHGDTPLHVAVYKGHINIVKLLISEKIAACPHLDRKNVV